MENTNSKTNAAA